ncbi:MAG: MFS transporter [Thermaerobacter sp.]|nr:MFS transporter [Thermaerobacter sp.]
MDVRKRLDEGRFGAFHRRLIFAGGFGILFDSLDVGILSFVMAALILAWKLAPTTIGLVGSINLVGMALGAAIAGTLSDRFGRRTVFLVTLLIYSLATGITGFATSVGFLIVMRFLVGVGLGGELPVTTTLVTEFLPKPLRGRGIVWLESFWAVGWIVASLVAYFLIPTYGWRIGFFIGAVPALYALYLRRGIPESPRYLWQAGDREKATAVARAALGEEGVADLSSMRAKAAPVSALFAPGRTRLTLSLWALWLMMNFAYYGMFLWLPSVLVERGFTLVHSFGYVLLVTLVQLPGYLSAGWLIERWGRRPVLVLYVLLAALSAAAFGFATAPGMVILFGCLLGFFNLGAWGVTYAYTTEQYPTLLRGTGSGWAMGVGRVGGIVAPFLVGALLASHTPIFSIFLMFAAAMLVALISALLVGEETKGRSLEEITGES